MNDNIQVETSSISEVDKSYLIRKPFFVGEWSYCKITSRNNTGTDSLSELNIVFNVCPEVEFLDNGEMKTSSAETGNVYWAVKGDSLYINSFLQIGSTSLPDNIYHIQVKDSDSTGIELTTIDKKNTYHLWKRIKNTVFQAITAGIFSLKRLSYKEVNTISFWS
jgi:hypothetical protein